MACIEIIFVGMKQMLLLALCALTITSCRPDDRYQINGHIKNMKDGEIYLVNLHTEEQDTVKVTDGKFSISGVATEPTPFIMFAPDIFQSQAIFFADLGKTKIEFTAKESSTLKIKGGKTHKEYEKFAEITKPLLAQFDSIQQLAMTGQIEGQEVQKIATKIQQDYEAENMKFVKDNPGSYVSALLTYEYIRQKPQLSAAEKKELMNALDSKIQKSHFCSKIEELIEADKATAIGNQAPSFTLPNTNGKKVKLESLQGQYVLIDFWASWCQPCRAENPNVVAAYKKFRNKKFTILGVSLDENKKQWEAAIQKDKLNWTQVSDLKGWNSSVVSLYNIKSIPSNILLDPSGKIIAKDLRGVDLENQLNNYLK